MSNDPENSNGKRPKWRGRIEVLLLVAGGLIDLTDEQLSAQKRPNLPLSPQAGGGLFKSVQAPQQPGAQTWAVMLVHPDGVVTATKRVRVVSSY